MTFMHKNRLVGFLAAAFLFSAGALHAGEALVVLKSSAQVIGRDVRLGEVAVIKDTDKETAAQLKGLTLCNAPNPGYTRYLARETVSARLRILGLEAEKIRLEGARGVLVSVKSVLISGEEINRMGLEFLEGEFAGLAGERVIESDRLSSDLLAPVGTGLTTFNTRWHGTPRTSGPVAVDLQILVDGKAFITVPLHFTIRIYDTVLMTTENLGRGDIFTAANTRLTRAEVTRVHGRPARTLEELSAYQASRRLQAGSIIRLEDGFMPNLVLRGKEVMVSVSNGVLTIRAKGIAKQNGALGDTVVVQNPVSGRTFRTMVTGRNEVQVKL